MMFNLFWTSLRFAGQKRTIGLLALTVHVLFVFNWLYTICRNKKAGVNPAFLFVSVTMFSLFFVVEAHYLTGSGEYFILIFASHNQVVELTKTRTSRYWVTSNYVFFQT